MNLLNEMIPHSRTTLQEKDFESINSCLKSGMTTLGEQNKSLRNEFGEYVGADYIRLTSSGTMAFYIILKALDIKADDDVLLPDYICSSLLGPIALTGCNPVLYDNQQKYWLSSPEEIMSKVTQRTRLVVVNHTFGLIFKQIEDLLSKLPEGINVIEDCCHAVISNRSHFSEYVNKHSLCAFYSFNSTKMLASGEGGAISTNDSSFAKELAKISIGDNLSDLNCSLARVQLKSLDEFLEKRHLIASEYMHEFKNHINKELEEKSGVFFRFPLFVARNLDFWKSKKVAYRKGVDSLLSQHLQILPQPFAKEQFDHTVSVPLYPSLMKSEINQIILETKKYLEQ